MNEFNIIKKYFNRKHIRNDVVIGPGDDGAVLAPPQNQHLVTSIDTLVSGVHFPENTSPEDIGYKSMAVSLSDMAAMGAEPAWVVATLTMPEASEVWLERFCKGFFALFDEYNIALVGGDLTKGPLSVSTQLMGFVPENKAFTRSGANPGDKIYVTGTLGDAALGLKCVKNEISLPYDVAAWFIQRLNRPTPRVKEALSMRGKITSAIDVSDGLVQDLSHILNASNVGAKIAIENLPFSQANNDSELALTGGDDFELCFTLPKEMSCEFTCIGEITASKKLDLLLHNEHYELTQAGYLHF